MLSPTRAGGALTGELAQAFAQGRPRNAIRLTDFLTEQCLESTDLYSSTCSSSGWTALKRAAGLEAREAGPDEAIWASV